MFETTKYSVCMKNATEDVKSKASIISVKDNNHNGVYWTLKKLLKEIRAK